MLVVLGSDHGRELLGFFNNTGKAQALAISADRAKGTVEAIVEYGMKTLPINIQDLLTPMGNYTDAQLMWSDALLAAKYIPAGVAYTVKSLPELLEEARQAVKTDWSNTVGLEHLVRCPRLAHSNAVQGMPGYRRSHAYRQYACCMRGAGPQVQDDLQDARHGHQPLLRRAPAAHVLP